MPRKRLTPKQRKFIAFYLVDLNGTQAAIKAGYSKKGADVASVRLLGNASVLGEIEKAQAKWAAETELSQEFVIDGLRQTLAMAIEDRQLNPANRSLELLGRHIGMFKEKLEVDTTDRLSSLLEAIQARPRPGPVLEHTSPGLPQLDSPTVLDATDSEPINSEDS